LLCPLVMAQILCSYNIILTMMNTQHIVKITLV
jgi:hypothetical protein